MSDTVFCGACGAKLPESAKFCHACGAPQDPVPAADERESVPVAGERESVPVAGERESVPVAGEQESVAVAGEQESVAAAGEQKGSSAAAPTASKPGVQAAPADAPSPAQRSLWGSGRGGQDPLPPSSSGDPAKAAASPQGPLSRSEWPPPPSPGAADPRAHRAAPGASELAGELAERLGTPGVIAAATVGAIALLVCLGVGLVTAIASPDRTIIGYLHGSDGAVLEVLRLTIATTLAGIRGGDQAPDVQLLPLIFGLAPFLGGMLGARTAAPKLTGMSVRDALAWSAGGAVVFAIGMLILALVANGQRSASGFELDFTIATVLIMSLLLVGAGATFGAWRAGRRLAPDRLLPEAPASVTGPARTVATPLLGLAALLAVTTVVGFVHTEVQTLRGQDDAVTSARSDAGAAIENLLFIPDLGIDAAGLALFGEFDDSVLAVSDGSQSDFADGLDDEGKGRIFSYGGALPIYVFLPELLLLVGAALLAALYSGFATARRAAAPTQLLAAGWGAVTGIVWAVALVLLRAMAFGQGTIGESVFAGALLIGTIAGAVGGVLAVRPAASGPSGPMPDVADG